MKASERLRKLGPPFDPTETHSWIEVEGEMREVNSMAALYDALPLIADVVREAEEIGFANDIHAYGRTADEYALPELTAALTALSNALEGGCDVAPIKDWGT